MIAATTGASEGVMEAGAEQAVNATIDNVTTADKRAMFIGQFRLWASNAQAGKKPTQRYR
jgi:hypothetical protein